MIYFLQCAMRIFIVIIIISEMGDNGLIKDGYKLDKATRYTIFTYELKKHIS
jgi:hypothetical protein